MGFQLIHMAEEYTGHFIMSGLLIYFLIEENRQLKIEEQQGRPPAR